MAGYQKMRNEIRVGGFRIQPYEVRKDNVVRLRGMEAYKVWNIIRRFNLDNPLIYDEVKRLLEEWIS